MRNQAKALAPVDLALIAVFAALIAVLTLAPAVPVGPVGVPITLQTLGVFLAGLVLGPWRGFAAVTLYLIVGFAGLPVFAGGGATLSVLGKPAAGFLLAFPFAALVSGLLSRICLSRGWKRRYLWLFLSGMVSSFLVVHPAGIAGMMVNGKLNFAGAVVADLAYWPGDIVKILIAAAVAVAVLKAFPRLAIEQPVKPQAAE